ncbi:MAG: hemolysin family protein [Oscillospiraceae bacterium]
MSDLPGQLLLQLFLIALNAFFAAAEIAVISLNSTRLKAQAEEGDKTAEKMLILVDEPTGFLSTIQIGITLAGFLGSAFAAENFAGLLTRWLVEEVGVTAVSPRVISSVSVVLVTLILSLFTLVFGELVPKRVAMRKAEQLARRCCGVILFLSKALKPLVWFTSVCTNGVLRLMGINPHDDGESVSEEDIRMMVDAGEEQGAIETMERDFIENIFEFNNIDASEVMIPRTAVTFIWADATKQEILDTISSSGFSRFPVCGEDSDDILGILRTREFLLALNDEDGEKFDMKKLVFPAAFFPETIKADALFREMQKRNTQMSIIVDEYGGMSGIVTMEDLLEELVGNIYDESDKITQEISLIGENTWRVSGDIALEDLDEVLGTELDKEDLDYNTLGGYIFDHIGYIPQDGSHEELTADGLHIRIETIEDRHIDWAVVTKLPQEEEAEEDAHDRRRQDSGR